MRSRTALHVVARTIVLLSGATLPLPAIAQSKQDKQISALLARPPQVLLPLITVKGDSLDPRIEVHTKGVTALVSKGLLASTTTENSFLRAFIDRKTGDVSAQVYHYATDSGRSAPSFRRATYETPDGIREVEADRVGFDVSCARYGCTYYEDVIFPINFATLEAAAKLYDASRPANGIEYRLFGQSGVTVDEGLPVNEIAAFVAVVNRERAKLKPSN